ncbi:STAS domain-containing protein [Alteromonas gracilis]|uniref:STAS domain-containing protein n=1 Tax=Alteromonas gracilis TaxID=1479524 RepID=UPI0037360A9C
MTTQKNGISDSQKIQHQGATIASQNSKIDAQRVEIDDLQEQIVASRFDLPLLKIAENVLMVPLVGSMDSVKSQKVMEDILLNIKEQATRVAVIDIAGINIVDSSVAAHLIKIAKATRLMGCRAIISGISPLIAQNIVNLGMDVSELITTNTLKDAMAEAYKLIGFELVKRT